MPQDNQQIIAMLKNIRLFDGLDSIQLDRVAAFAHPVLLKEGESLHLDATSTPLFIVVSGKVRLTRSNKGSEGEASMRLSMEIFSVQMLYFMASRNQPALTP